jgi:hypothetical protein
MAVKSGNTGVIKMHTADGSEAAVGQTRNFSIESTSDTLETTVLGNADRTYISGLKGHTVSVEAYWDEADPVQILLDPGTTIFFEVHPTGTGTGEEYYHGQGIVASKSISAAADGMVEASFSLTVSGAITPADNS